MAVNPGIALEILEWAKEKGATEGDVIILEEESISVHVRLAQVERIKKADEKKLGLRLFSGKRSSVTSTSDFSKDSLERLVADTLELAKATPEDEYSGLPSQDRWERSIPDLDLFDKDTPDISVQEKIELAKRAEAASLSYDPKIANSEGAEFKGGSARVIYANSYGFLGQYQTSSFSLWVLPIASKDGSMQRDLWYSSKRKFSCLESPESVGEKAAKRALGRLGARKIKTQEAPVIFDPETAASLLNNLFAAISGHSIYRRASYLVGKLGEKIASSQVSIYDDGTIPSGLGSRPFDGEGLPTRKTTVVEDGILMSYLLDTYSAKKLGLSSTGNAVRSAEDSPSIGPTNLYLAPGKYNPEEIIKSVQMGLYIIELIGLGVNPVTGDYSRGAVGLWIENGEVVYPVQEITIAGNLMDMFLGIEMVGNDLDFRRRASSPTIKIAKMTIAGD